MMTAIFTTILNMSLTAGYCIVAVVLLRFFLKKQPKLLSYLLWSVVLFRLLCPFSLSSSYSLLPMHMNVASQEYLAVRHPEQQLMENNLNTGAVQMPEKDSGTADAVSTAQDERTAVSHAQIFFRLGAWVWFAGALLFAAYGVLSVFRLKKLLRGAICVEDNIYEAKNLPSPFVCGIVRPRIYLPAGLSVKERNFVVAHERVHAARKDYLVKLLAWSARCIHWFNPLVWLFFALLENDMEMSCDEAVLHRLGMEAKEEYSRAVLSLSYDKMRTGGCPPAFGEGVVKERIRNILAYRKRTAAVVAATALLLVVVAAGLALNPAGRKLGDREAEELLRLGEKDQFVTDYANAWCSRNGELLIGFYVDEDTAFRSVPMFDKTDGVYSYGFSSPWPYEFWRTIPTGEGKDEGTSEIRYYAWTSDPHVSVWKEEITFAKTKTVQDDAPGDSGYRVTGSTLTYYDSIASEAEYMDAYWGDGAYHFADYVENGFVESINFQTESDMENGEADRNAVYRSPETAAEYIMNLTGGTGTAQISSNGTAVVEYTFADGSSVLIPMIDINFDGRTGNTQQDGTETERAVRKELWILDLDVWNAGAP